MTDRVFDLDAARAARGEAEQEQPIVVVEGQKFALPVRLPVRYAFFLAEGETEKALRLLLRDQFDELWDILAYEDVADLLAGINRIYGLGKGRGEAPASGGSSKSSGIPSRPTSPRTTTSTSRKPASRRKT